MTLYPWVREYINKYSFVEKIEFKNTSLYIYYKKDGKVLYKRLPYRATKHQVMRAISRIKKDINYYEKRDARLKELESKDKPLIFG